MAEIKNIFLGTTQVDKLLAGTDLVFEADQPDTTAPITTVYPSPSEVYQAGQQFWLEVNEACDTYYTLDGSTPTTDSTLFTEPFNLDTTTTVKYFSVDLAGNTETVKTTEIMIEEASNFTLTIDPSETVQNNFPITVTLSTDSGETIYYKLGTGAQQTYTAPFEVSQDTAGVQSTQITVAYWTDTIAENSITYDTSGAMPETPIIEVTNEVDQVTLNWNPTANTTSYNVYRSTISGEIGELLSQWQTANNYTDTTAQGGTDYYYTVRASNFNNIADSEQMLGSPSTGGSAQNWRYVRFQGYGDQTGGTSRLVELQALEASTNHLLNLVPISGETPNGGGPIEKCTDGNISYVSGEYPFWWTGAGVPNLVYDLGVEQAVDTIRVAMYSPAADPRQTKFKVFVSTDNANWTIIADYSTNTNTQTEDGWTFTLG